MADIRVRLGSSNAVKVVSSISGGAGTLSELEDIDVSNGLSNGMILVYNASLSKWEATLELTPSETQNLSINGGNF
jgi:hypothetical protein